MLLKNGTALLFEQGGFVSQDIRVKNGKISEMAQILSPKQAKKLWMPAAALSRLA